MYFSFVCELNNCWRSFFICVSKVIQKSVSGSVCAFFKFFPLFSKAAIKKKRKFPKLSLILLIVITLLSQQSMMLQEVQPSVFKPVGFI